ncbi:MAG: histidine phosphatase family protein [Ferruginibacter sp.]
MKSLYLVRHAKSSWSDFELSDFDRPLNERGKSDAPEMAKRLLKKNIKIDTFVSSPAKRAKKTAILFCEQYEFSENKIIYVDSLYHASDNVFYEVIGGLQNKLNDVALFSHNPGITDFVNSLCKGIRIDNVPTCGVFGITLAINNWKDFREAEKKFVFFDYPKTKT